MAWQRRDHVLRDADQHRAHVLLLAHGQAPPELVGGYRAVGRGSWRRSGGVGWHRCGLLYWHVRCHEQHAVIVQQRQAIAEKD